MKRTLTETQDQVNKKQNSEVITLTTHQDNDITHFLGCPKTKCIYYVIRQKIYKIDINKNNKEELFAKLNCVLIEAITIDTNGKLLVAERKKPRSFNKYKPDQVNLKIFETDPSDSKYKSIIYRTKIATYHPIHCMCFDSNHNLYIVQTRNRIYRLIKQEVYDNDKQNTIELSMDYKDEYFFAGHFGRITNTRHDGGLHKAHFRDISSIAFDSKNNRLMINDCGFIRTIDLYQEQVLTLLDFPIIHTGCSIFVGNDNIWGIHPLGTNLISLNLVTSSVSLVEPPPEIEDPEQFFITTDNQVYLNESLTEIKSFKI